MNLENICRQVITLSREVGEFIHQESYSFDLSRIEHKGMNDLVSYVDREAENRIVKALKTIIPDSAFITEEDERQKAKTDKTYHWIVDPLDGTTNFMHGLPFFAISIALMQQDSIVLGVVYEINRQECFYAWKDGGAFCNDKKIRVSPIQYLKDSLLATGFPYRDFDQAPAYMDIIRELMLKSHGLRRMGSASVDLAYVAAGRFEGFFEYNLNAWDVAAGAFLVQEAGGKVSTFKGTDDFIFGKEIIAGCKMQHEMVEIIRKHWEK